MRDTQHFTPKKTNSLTSCIVGLAMTVPTAGVVCTPLGRTQMYLVGPVGAGDRTVCPPGVWVTT